MDILNNHDLVDLRKKYSGDESTQNFALSRHYPTAFSRQELENAGLQSTKFDKTEFDCLDAATCVLRHLFSRVGSKWREGNDNNPLESMVWADLAESSDTTQTLVRYAILEKLREELGDKVSLDYYHIMENKSMHKTIWVREAFMLWHKAVFERRKGSDKWTQVEYKIPPTLAKYGLLQYDGKVPLGDRISSEYGPDEHEELEVELHWQSNSPAIIRVLYDNTRSRSVSRTFKELARITVDGQRLKEEDDGQGRKQLVLKIGLKDLIDYQLVASVRLGDKNDKNNHKDRIRLYRADGEPMAQHSSLVDRFAGSRWKLGEEGRFMLYYAPVLHRQLIDGREPPECAEHASGAIIKQMVEYTRPRERSDGEEDQERTVGELAKVKHYQSWRDYLVEEQQIQL